MHIAERKDMNKLSKQEQDIDEMISEIRERLKNAPEGGLRIIHNHGSAQYYRRGKCNEYIRKSDISLVRALAQKEYDKKILRILESEKKKMNHCWKGYDLRELARVYEELSEDRKELVTPCILSDEEFIKRWENREYERKPIGSNAPEIYTEKGERVRSKSEKMIADKLFVMGVPYRYEYPLFLNGYGIIYPDFTLLDVAGRREIILEHLGMMDKEEYGEKAIRKIKAYERNGIFPGDRLILTYETSRISVDLRIVQMLVENVMTG